MVIDWHSLWKEKKKSSNRLLQFYKGNINSLIRWPKWHSRKVWGCKQTVASSSRSPGGPGPQPALTCGHVAMRQVRPEPGSPRRAAVPGVAARWDDSAQFSQPWIPNIGERKREAGSVQDNGSAQSAGKWDSYEEKQNKSKFRWDWSGGGDRPLITTTLS